jgi:hypothetical protein
MSGLSRGRSASARSSPPPSARAGAFIGRAGFWFRRGPRLAEQLIDLLFQLRQILLNGAPDDLQIHREIGVSNDIVHVRPWKLRMLSDELRGHATNVVHGLADNFDIADDHILHERVLLEGVKVG